MAGQNGNGRFNFGSNGNGNGHGGNDDPFGPEYRFEDDDENHEHTYVNIVQSQSIAAYEELVHEVVTLEFHDRGLTLDFSREEAEELGRVLSEIVAYLKRKKA